MARRGSLLYRVSYGMTGGYVRSLEDARADDEAIAAAEAAAREAAAGFAAAGEGGAGARSAEDRGSRWAGFTQTRGGGVVWIEDDSTRDLGPGAKKERRVLRRKRRHRRAPRARRPRAREDVSVSPCTPLARSTRLRAPPRLSA